MTMKKIYTLYQTNNPNTLGGYMTYSTLSEALDTIGQIGFNGMLIDTITAVTMVDSEWWHGHRTGHVSEILSQGVIYKLSEKKSKHTSQMRKENKILVTDIGEIDEVKVIFDDDNKPYLYSYNGEDEFYRPDETYKFFDNKEQAEEYVRENMAPFDRNKVKEYLTKRYKDSGISDIKDILPDSLIKEYSNHSLHITDLGWIQCALLKNALKGILCVNAITFRKEEVAYIKYGEHEWVEITLRDDTKVTPRNEDENAIIRWCFGRQSYWSLLYEYQKTCGNRRRISKE